MEAVFVNRVLLCNVFLVVFALSAKSALAAGSNDPCTEYETHQHVAELSWDQTGRLGSSVLLTFDGYLVTAAHTLVQSMQPPLPLKLFARFSEGIDSAYGPWLAASLVDINNDIDLALIKLDTIPGREQAKLGLSNVTLNPGDPVCIVGFGTYRAAQGQAINEGLQAVPAKVSSFQIGYIVPDAPFENGFSGGGLFHDGRLVGVNLRRRAQGGSFVIPSTFVRRFISASGLYADSDGTVSVGTPLEDLQERIRGNSRAILSQNETLDRVLRSIEWDIRLEHSEPDALGLVLEAQRAFPDQVLDGWFSIEVFFHFDDDALDAWLSEGKELLGVVVRERINGRVVRIDDLHEELDDVVAQYLPYNILLSGVPPTRVTIKPQIMYVGGRRQLQPMEIHLDDH